VTAVHFVGDVTQTQGDVIVRLMWQPMKPRTAKEVCPNGGLIVTLMYTRRHTTRWLVSHDKWTVLFFQNDDTSLTLWFSFHVTGVYGRVLINPKKETRRIEVD
jgi:hypothetical protein